MPFRSPCEFQGVMEVRKEKQTVHEIAMKHQIHPNLKQMADESALIKTVDAEGKRFI